MFCLSTVELATSKAMLAAYRASEEQGDGKHRLYRCGIRKASLRLSSHPICSVSSVSRHHEARLHDAVTVEVMLAITLTPMRRCSPPALLFIAYMQTFPGSIAYSVIVIAPGCVKNTIVKYTRSRRAKHAILAGRKARQRARPRQPAS